MSNDFDEEELIEIPAPDLQYNNDNTINIEIKLNKKESLQHFKKDYEILLNEGIEKFIKNNFIPWLKGDNDKDLDDEKVYNGLALTYVSYHYGKICAKYSPTKEDGFFGQFEFCFESCNEYTENLLQAAVFIIAIDNGKVYYYSNYDV